jgi:molybdopterin molybdotransferase
MPTDRMVKGVTRIEEAARLFYESLQLTRRETDLLPIQDCMDSVLAFDLIATDDIPNADKSAVDGYALQARDTFSASSISPTLLGLRSKILGSQLIVGRGEAVYVHTGAPLPRGSDAVVMIEFTEKVGPDTIEVYKAVAPGEDVSWKGEDVRKGEVVLREGTRLRPQDLGMLAALGLPSVQVYRKPLVGIISTGSELVSLNSEKRLDRVVDVNSIILSAMVAGCGGRSLPMGIVKDEFHEIKSRISEGLEKSDLLILSGGTSEGLADLTVKAIDSLGKPGVVVHGIAMRPGRPTALACLQGKPVISLSGYPVAAMMGFYLFVKPLLAKMLRTTDPLEPEVRARVTRRIASAPGLRSFVRVAVSKSGDDYIADPVRTTGSGILSSMIKANGLIVIPEDVEGVDENDEVDVKLFGPIGQRLGNS